MKKIGELEGIIVRLERNLQHYQGGGYAVGNPPAWVTIQVVDGDTVRFPYERWMDDAKAKPIRITFEVDE